MRGTIALDIDGTLTAGSFLMPPKTIAYLSSLAAAGWRLIFITGRTFTSGYKALKDLPFNYYVAVQNGAIIMEMPSRRVVAKKYLDQSIFRVMDAICQSEPTDFVIYGGFEHQDHCYFRPSRFSPALLEYLQNRTKTFEEVWHSLETYDQMELSAFPSIKCFGHELPALELAGKIEKSLGLHVPVIRDPFSTEYYVVQATHPMINKGQALLDFIAMTGERGHVIAAGDDYNDLPMLAAADTRIVMNTAPADVRKQAHIIAASAEEEGIILALEAAIKHVGMHRI